MRSNFINYFENSFRKNWDLPAMTNYETKQILLYKDVAKEVALLHILFQELNVQKDDKIAVIGDNSPEWVIVFLATITYGAIIVPILQTFNVKDQLNIINQSDATVLFIDENRWKDMSDTKNTKLKGVYSLSEFRCIDGIDKDIRALSVDKLNALFVNLYQGGFDVSDVKYQPKEDEEVVALNYTSGTLGYSKGVMTTGDNYCCVFEYSDRYNYGTVGDKVISILPMAHAYACVNDMMNSIRYGGHIFFIDKHWNTDLLIDVMQDVKPQYISLVPIIMEDIIKRRMYVKEYETNLLNLSEKASLCNKVKALFGGEFKSLYIAGASFDRDIELFLRMIKFPFIMAYGMTECSPTVCVGYGCDHAFSVGRPIDGVSIRIDSNDPLHIAGEILIKGRNVTGGYYKNENETKKLFNEEGWLKTGDLGVVDADGNLYLRGRAKVMILSSTGQNIYPEEIESKLNNLPYIQESVVVQKNSGLVALVYPNKEIMSNYREEGDINEFFEKRRKEINKLLASYEHISQIIALPFPIEKTAKGTIKRNAYECQK